MKVEIYKSNFGWSENVQYINGWIPKFAFFIPIIGYLILFNDSISSKLMFNNLTNENIFYIGLEGTTRLRFIYFGLILLGLSNILYIIRKPYSFRFGTTFEEYTKKCLDVFTLGDFNNLHKEIENNPYGPSTSDGKYLSAEYDNFFDDSNYDDKDFINWEEAKSKYGNLLRKILRETFFNLNRENLKSLIFCMILSFIGYLLLFIPSLDLFIKVILSTFN